MIFVRPFLTTFETTLSYSHVFFILSLFLSLYCFCPIKIEKKWLSQKLYKIGCRNITPLIIMPICWKLSRIAWRKLQNFSLHQTLHEDNTCGNILAKLKAMSTYIHATHVDGINKFISYINLKQPLHKYEPINKKKNSK